MRSVRPGFRPTPVIPRGRPAPARTEGAWSWHPIHLLRRSRLSIAFFGFLVYLTSIVTYRFPLATVGMAIALAAIPFERYTARKWFPPPVLFIGLFLAWAALGVFLTPVIAGNKWEEVIELGKIWLIFFSACLLLASLGRIRFLIAAFAFLFLLFPVRGALANYFVYGHRPFGRMVWNYIYDNPNDLAGFSLIAITLLGVIVATSRKGWIKVAAATGMGFVTSVVFFSRSRSGFLGLAVFALLWIVFVERSNVRRAVTVLLIAGLAVVVAPRDLWTRLSGLRNVTSSIAAVDEEGSARQRLMIMKIGLHVASDYPVFGVGLGLYPIVHGRYAARDFSTRFAEGERDTHNTFIRILAETGIVGLLLFVGSIASVVLHAWKALKQLPDSAPSSKMIRLLSFGLAAFLVTGLFQSYGVLSFLYLHLALLWASGEIVLRRKLERV